MKLLAPGLLLGGLLMGNNCPALAQTGAYSDPAEIAPELLQGGGSKAVVAAVQQRLVYPPQALRDHAEGRVLIGFTVTVGGLVKNAHVLKSLRPDCDAAALQAGQKLPRFKPGQQFGKPGACGYVVPVKFSRNSWQRVAK